MLGYDWLTVSQILVNASFFFNLQHLNIACFPRSLINFAFNIPHQAHSETSVCKRFAFDFVFYSQQIKLYAFGGYRPHFYEEKASFFLKNPSISVVRPFIILLSFCTKNGIIKLLFSCWLWLSVAGLLCFWSLMDSSVYTVTIFLSPPFAYYMLSMLSLSNNLLLTKNETKNMLLIVCIFKQSLFFL